MLALALLISAQPAPPVTTAERTNYAETTRHAAVVAFCDDLAKQFPAVKHQTFGKSGEDRPLPLLVLSDPPVSTPAEAAKLGKPIVFVQANIHAGEVDGKEAVLALARDLAADKEKKLLKKLVILIAPNINPDGNEKLGRGNRPGQVGPDLVGLRENATGLDLNRDFVKLESPEIRAVTKLWTAWDPLVMIDCHTTNGSQHRYTLTYDGPRHPGAGDKLVGYCRGTFLPDIQKRIKAATGFDTYPYGNFDGTRSKWESYPATPRFGVQAAALRGRFGLLSESYSYAPFADRVKASYAFVKAACEHVAENADAVKAATANTGDVVLTTKAVADPEKATILGFVEEMKDGKRVRTAETKDYAVESFLKVEAVTTVKLPAAYFVRAEATAAIELLRRHGVKVDELREDIDLDVLGFVPNRVTTADREFQKHKTRTWAVVPTQGVQRLPAGTAVVKTAQPLGRLAAFLLEPGSEDGFGTWNVYDDFNKAAPLPVFKTPTLPPMVLGNTRPLPEDRLAKKPITVADMNRVPNLAGNVVGGIAWVDAEHFTQLKDGKIWKVKARTGEVSPLYDEALLEKSKSAVRELARAPRFGGLAGRGAPAEEPAKPYVLLRAAAEFAVAYYDGSPAVKITTSGGNKEFGTLSPTGKTLAFVREGNLFSVDVATKKEAKLTADGGGDVLNGRADWVYEEEIFNRNGRAYWWSDDGLSLAFLRFDDAPVKKFTLSVPFPNRGGTEVLNYPKAGDPNPTVKLGVVRPGETPALLDLGDYKPDDTLIARVGFMPKSNTVFAFVQNRVQTWLDFVVWDSPTAKPRKLFRDSTKAWIDDPGAPHFLADGSFLFFSERTGWKHLYHYAADGTLKAAVTSGEWEARDLLRVDEAAGVAYVGGTKDGSTKINLYRVKLDGSETKLLSDPAFSHQVSVAPAGGLWVDRSTDLNTPVRVTLRDGDGKVVRTLDSNPVYESEAVAHCPTERVTIPTPDGFALEGIVIKPHGFDPAKKYPLWVQTYAGPHTPTVRDAWTGGRIFDQAIANMGVVLLKVDPRGASGKGAVSAWVGFRKLGVNELKDLETAVAFLAKNPWIDANRVGLSGHSYGGYITAFALTHSKVFSAGISGAPVTDWRLYDSIYTERFMGLPKENADGYDASSVVKAAANLHGKLLLIHGLADDNVHFQNTAQFIDALQAANKPFEVMVYPRARHGIGGPHYQQLQLDFIRRAMELK